jgi:hypothetical protein
MRTITASLLRSFDLVALAEGNSGADWIEGQRVFFLWEKVPLHVRISPAQ